ncbi:MAG TPA: DHHA1 domain-containing protein, partial [Elusimicrobiota bacterium]|nr:DHHA1 domain-containing protein [Elusimicrobiota bacterium]
VLVDCGTGESKELLWLAEKGIDVIIADHHRMSDERPPAYAWIHPEMSVASPAALARAESAGIEPASPPAADPGGQTASAALYAPAGCVMAFKLAQGLWTSFLGEDDPERLDYFLYDHLDLLSLGILADRVPLVGENRILVWHGLRRLARTRKTGLQSLLRFFRLWPRTGAVTVREASWQIIPLLNAAGRLRQPQWASNLLLTEDAWESRDCIDELLELNSRRRDAQQKSLDHFERMVLEQCAVETDPVLLAIGKDLEPSVTGLAAGALAVKYGKPVFLFVHQGAEAVGSGRGTPEYDLFAWVETHRDILVKFGGHEGAVGLTVKSEHFKILRQRFKEAGPARRLVAETDGLAEASLPLAEADDAWWAQFQQLEPFGTGFPCPLFELTGVEAVRPARPRSQKVWLLTAGSRDWLAEGEGPFPSGDGPWTVLASPTAGRKGEPTFKWIIQSVARS